MKRVIEPSEHTPPLSGEKISRFLSSAPIFVFDPQTLTLVAEVFYRDDGSVEMKTIDGSSDKGAWGINEDFYS